MTVLGIQLINELLDEGLFVFDNLGTGCPLNIDILSQLLAVLLLLKLLPVPVNLNILLVRLDDFLSDLVLTLNFLLGLQGTTVILDLFSVGLDGDDVLHRGSLHLLKDA